MTKSVARTAAFVALLCLSRTSAAAQVPGCSRRDAIAAKQNVDRLRTWTDLRRQFRRYAACDDGSIAEGWDDFVAQTLANHWDRIAELKRLTDRDHAFRGFVIRHIADTASALDLERARRNAEQRCPPSANALCRDIVRAIGHR